NPPTNDAIHVARIIAIGAFTPLAPSRGQPLMPAANTMSVIDGADGGNRADLDRALRAMPSSPERPSPRAARRSVMSNLVLSREVYCPLDQTFAYHTDLTRAPQWWPNLMEMSPVEGGGGPAAVGDRYRWSY